MQILKGDPQKSLDLLDNADNILADSSNWIQKVNAVRADGYRIGPNDSQACAWCLDGAILNNGWQYRVLRLTRYAIYKAILSIPRYAKRLGNNAITSESGCEEYMGYVIVFNDHRLTTYEQVKEVIAIAAAILTELRDGQHKLEVMCNV